MTDDCYCDQLHPTELCDVCREEAIPCSVCRRPSHHEVCDDCARRRPDLMATDPEGV